jgi:hypothetical protein
MLTTALGALTGTEYIDGPTAIATAIASGDSHAALSYIKSTFRNTPLSGVRQGSRNILHLLARSGQRSLASSFSELVKLILSRLTQSEITRLLDERDDYRVSGHPDGDQPLHSAVRNGNIDLAYRYLDAGANPRATGAGGLRVHGDGINTYGSQPATAPSASGSGMDPERLAQAIIRATGMPKDGLEIDTFTLDDTHMVERNGSSMFIRPGSKPLTTAPRAPAPLFSEQDATLDVYEPASSQLGGAKRSAQHSSTARVASHKASAPTQPSIDTEDVFLQQMHDQYYGGQTGGASSAKNHRRSASKRVTGSRKQHFQLDSAHDSSSGSDMEHAFASSGDDYSSDYDEEETGYGISHKRAMRNYLDEDQAKHDQVIADISKHIGSPYVRIQRDDDPEVKRKKFLDNLPVAAIKATLWKKTKELVKKELDKLREEGKEFPKNVNSYKTDRFVELAQKALKDKKYFNSIKDDIAVVEADMRTQADSFTQSSVDLPSESSADGKRGKRGNRKKAVVEEERSESAPKKSSRSKKPAADLEVSESSDEY